MSHVTNFASDYHDARRRFLAAAAAAGAQLQTYENTTVKGPRGESLFTDVARLGAVEAKAVLFVNSATHGVEGYAGSACQVTLLGSRLIEDLPPDLAIVITHALNCYGFAHERRVCEGNVDLNRNFVNHATPPPDAPGYAELHPWLTPLDWAQARLDADAQLDAWIQRHGVRAFQSAVTGGQYTFADGLFFGGRAPVWSNRLWRMLLDLHAGNAERAALIDLHTGLGPNGVGECIYIGPEGDDGYARAAAWWEHVTSTEAGTSASAPVRGALANTLAGLGCQSTAIALEFGATPLDDMLAAVRADNWLYARAGPTAPEHQAIKRQIRAAFYDESDAWKRAVTERAVDVFASALTGLQND